MANQNSVDTMREKFLAHVVANPGITTRQLARAFGMTSRAMGSALHQMKDRGHLVGTKEPGVRSLHWTATGKAAPGEAQQRIVTDAWAPHLARCPLTSALFGAPTN